MVFSSCHIFTAIKSKKQLKNLSFLNHLKNFTSFHFIRYKLNTIFKQNYKQKFNLKILNENPDD